MRNALIALLLFNASAAFAHGGNWEGREDPQEPPQAAPPAPLTPPSPSQTLPLDTLAVGPSSILVLADTQAFVDASLMAIQNARASIDLEMFDFANERLINALAARARDVPVRLVLDPWMGRDPQEIAHKKRMIELMRQAGARVAFYPIDRLHGAIFKIDHLKLLVADGWRAVTGGGNWDGDGEIAQRRDYNLRLEGTVVGRLNEVFAQDWALANGLPTPPRQLPSLDPTDDIQILVTDAEHREPREAILRRIAAARKIRAEELLLDEPAVIDALIAAQRRGADIELILDPNNFFFGGVNAETAQRLKETGVPVKLFRDPSGAQNLLHAKLAVFDDEAVILGSVNWSHNALNVNHELAVMFRDAPAARELTSAFDADWTGRSAEPQLKRGLCRFLQRLVSAITYFFS